MVARDLPGRAGTLLYNGQRRAESVAKLAVEIRRRVAGIVVGIGTALGERLFQRRHLLGQVRNLRFQIVVAAEP